MEHMLMIMIRLFYAETIERDHKILATGLSFLCKKCTACI